MAGITDLEYLATPYLAIMNGGGVEGRDWAWKVTNITDSVGSIIDLSATTGVCKVINPADSSALVTLTYTGASDGSFMVRAAASATTNAAITALWSTYTTGVFTAMWSLTVTESSKVLPFWNRSPFTLSKAGT